MGPIYFTNSLNELKPFLKFNPQTEGHKSNYDIILFHENILKDKEKADIINNSVSLKICASFKKTSFSNYDAVIELPFTLNDINSVVETIAAKKIYSINSSIKIKNYLLNKNEKKLSKDQTFIILTEKEIQLLELLLKNKHPVSKEKILSSVWNYSTDADTHTVETHIYRLRKKINDNFLDENFIINTKHGYSF